MIQKLFSKPVVLTSKNSVFLPKITDYKFAKSVAFIPIGAQEIVEAQKCYPIFFIKDSEGVVPFVAMGVQEGRNLFINEDGSFKDNFYIPAIFRAYPFSVTKINNNFSLVVDEQSFFAYRGNKRLFDQDGNLTQDAQKVVKIVEDIYADLFQTKEILTVLDQKNLLKSVDITIKTPQKEYIFENMLIVDEKKIKELKDSDIVTWYKMGLLDIITLHFASLSNIARLGKEAVSE